MNYRVRWTTESDELPSQMNYRVRWTTDYASDTITSIPVHKFWLSEKLQLFLFFKHLTFCRFCMIIRFFSSPSQRPMTSDFEGFYPYFFLTILILEKEPVFSLFECWVPNMGTTGTIFITSLVWHGSRLGIEPEPPALEASTVPLGYQGGSCISMIQ